MSYSKYNPSKDITTKIIRCPYSKCHARIIKPSQQQSIHEIKIGLKFLKIDKPTIEDEKNEDKEVIDDYEDKFLRIEDAWDFDNIGVSREIQSNTIEGINKDDVAGVERLIVCADCERGPLGFAKYDEKEGSKDVKNLKYFLHLDSCLYQD